jgi:hypothetical protein
MAFFEDLTPYACVHFEKDPPGTLNVGWLDRSHPYSTGATSPEFQHKLARLCAQPVRQTRGLHRCPFCHGRDRPGGSAEIRVGAGGRIYAAPTLVHHYVAAHNYRPPDEFIAAVLAWDGLA